MAVPRIAHLSHKSVLELSGPDAQKFLKGLSCKDVEYLGGGYSGFLNASGRVLHTAFIFPRSKNSYLITHESPEDHPAPLLSLLPPFKLRSKVRIKDVTNQWDAWSAWGSDLQGGPHPIRTWKMGSGGASESHWDWEGGIRDLGLRDDEAGCWDLRAGWPRMGRQLLVPKGEKPSLATSHDLGNVHDYELHRMLLGVPEGPEEILPGQALPLESCMDIHGGVDFRKGCYLGQELTVRTYHTGATRKRILPIRLIPLDQSSSSSISDLLSFSPQQSLAEVDIPLDITYHPPSTSATRKPRSAGKILSLHNAVGLALVRLEMAERCWWSGDILRSSVSQWLDSGAGKLTTQVNGKEWGVYVEQGEAYAAALEHMPSSS
ncbi:mitochondrial protein [Cryptococcus gattii Ru294]|nr:mitochondrial protein [Cryptococcus gattii Ru294]